MADKDEYNDEYQFADLDPMSPDVGDTAEVTEVSSESPEGRPLGAPQNNVKRKALIVVGVVILVIVIFELMRPSAPQQNAIKPIVPTVTTVAPTPVQSQPVVVPVVEAPPTNVDAKMNEKLATLESIQQSMRSDVSSVNTQLGGISTNINDMMAKMAELNGVIANLSAKVDEQSHEIEQLTIRREAAKKVHHVLRKATHYPKYYIQAVIPGRAWLIATNGATLTVREGTVVAGYGTVRLIDPNQGRITTSSGQVIRFSQEDS